MKKDKSSITLRQFVNQLENKCYEEFEKTLQEKGLSTKEYFANYTEENITKMFGNPKIIEAYRISMDIND